MQKKINLNFFFWKTCFGQQFPFFWRRIYFFTISFF